MKLFGFSMFYLSNGSSGGKIQSSTAISRFYMDQKE